MKFASYRKFKDWYSEANITWNSIVEIEINNIIYHTPGEVFEAYEE